MNARRKPLSGSGVARAAALLGAWLTVGWAETPSRLFDDSTLQDVHLFVDRADWQKLRDNYLLDTYYPAKFVWNDIELPRVGIRSRGSGSRSPYKPNLLVAFNRYDANQRLFGLASVVLKANNQDASLLREVLAMKLFRRMGLPAPLEAPARLYVNGEFFGAYTLVESIDEAFLMRNFGEDSGYLYDWQEDRINGYRFEYLGPDPSLYVPTLWDPKTRKSNPDAANIVAMVRAVNEVSDAGFLETVSRYIDLKQFVIYLATENFLADCDGFVGQVFGMNNMYWYRFAAGDPFVLIPWDKDGTFDWPGNSVFQGVEENVLARRALQVPQLRKLYLEALVKASQLAGGPGGWLEQELDRLYDQVREIAHADPHKQCMVQGSIVSCTGEDFERGIAWLRGFVRARAEFVLEEAAAAGYSAAEAESAPRIESVGNAASDELAAVRIGSLLNLYGQRLASRSEQSGSGQGSRRLAGVVVTVNGARAPLLHVSPDQINLRLPEDLAPGEATLTVFVEGRPSNAFTILVQD
ncbi:MAG: CotH kinase family protein [Bryobacterales bacterium]|nr:CotH kinase family protein [Bryobacteraceae bacterium]MDW8131890.1 CotH kinase family protein [Bryobacterales bacterium]